MSQEIWSPEAKKYGRFAKKVGKAVGKGAVKEAKNVAMVSKDMPKVGKAIRKGVGAMNNSIAIEARNIGRVNKDLTKLGATFNNTVKGNPLEVAIANKIRKSRKNK